MVGSLLNHSLQKPGKKSIFSRISGHVPIFAWCMQAESRDCADMSPLHSKKLVHLTNGQGCAHSCPAHTQANSLSG